MSWIANAIIIILAILNVGLLICLIVRYKRSKKPRASKLSIIKFSKSIVITIFSLLISYVVTVLIIFVNTGNEPVTLTENLFGFFKAEGGFLAIIKVAEGVAERSFANKRGRNPVKENEEDLL